MKTTKKTEASMQRSFALFRSYMGARHAYEATEATISALRSCFAEVPQQLESLHASQKAEAEAIREEIEATGCRVTIDVMNGYRPALASPSGCLLLS